MIRQLYKFLPTSIRTKAYMTVEEQVRQEDAMRSKEIEAALPRIELKTKNIQNLRVLLDRDALLNVLPKHSIVAEVGVARGDFSNKILTITKPKELHLIDSWVHDEYYMEMKKFVENRYSGEIETGQVFVHQGLSTVELEKFKSGYFDWIYIDTSHDYITTAQELEICRDKVNKGGTITGHDYVLGNWLDRIRYGVIEAVNEFCMNYDWEMIYLTHESNRHLSFALKEISNMPQP